MFMLELSKLRRRKLLYSLPLVVIFLFLLEFVMGNQLYQGHRYGSVNGWYLENGFFFLNYYFLHPFSSMIVVDLIRIEQDSKTIENLRLIPVDLKRFIQSKFILALLMNLLLSELIFFAMLVLEMIDGELVFSNLTLLSWVIGYGVVAFAYTLFANLIVLFLGKCRRELILAVPFAFLLSFAGLFTLSTAFGQYYLVNLPLLIMKEFTLLTVFVYAIWFLVLLSCVCYFLADRGMIKIIFAYK
ncbi:TPA: ABC transporter permease [Streptococcus suis]